MSGIEEGKFVCAKCGAQLKENEKRLWEGPDGKPIRYCNNCVDALNDEFQKQTLNPNVPMALIYGIGAAIVTAVLYYIVSMLTNTTFDIILIGLGFCIAYAVTKGAGDKRGKALQVIAVILTLLACVAADGCVGLTKVAAQDGLNLISFVLKDGLISIIGSVVILPFAAIKVAGLMGMLFWLLGGYVALVYAAKDRVREYKEKK